MAVLVAFVSSLLWGGSDFLGGLAARRTGVLRATHLGYVSALVVALGAALAVPARWSAGGLGWGAAAGVAGTVGFLTFYAGMASGAMGPMSGIVAVVESVVPVAVAVGLQGERLGALGWTGLGGALVGGVMLAETSSGRGGVTPRTVTLGLVSGAAFGCSILGLDRAPADSGAVPVAAELGISLVLVSLLVALRRTRPVAAVVRLLDPVPLPPEPAGRRQALAAGLLLGTANVLVLVALRTGALAPVAVVVSLYPLATVVLARVVLHERLTGRQHAGIALALASCAALAAA